MSHVIRVARVTCIFLMMYTHVRPYPSFERFPQLPHDYVLHLIYAVPALLLGKASVPLLGAVSGWLFALTYRGGWRGNALKKARTVLLPLFLWNALLLVILWSVPTLEPRWARPDDAIGWIDKFIPLIEYPTNSPLYFLRDLFLCMLAAPALLALFAAKGRVAMAWTFAATCLYAIVAHEYWLLTRPVILPTFVGGLILARLGTEVRDPGFFKGWLLAAAAVWTVIELCVVLPLTGAKYVWLPMLGNLPEVLNRFALAYLLWWGIVALAKMSLGRAVAQIEPFIFFVFCTHHIVQIFVWAMFGQMVRGPFSPAYPFYFFAQPVIAMLVGVALYRLMATVAPRTLGVLTGGRIAQGNGTRRWAVA